MKLFKNVELLRPFSHVPGIKFPIPFSSKGIQIFPAALILMPEGERIPLSIQGPVDGFTAILDLERDHIKVFGKAKSGYFRYVVYVVDGRLCFKQEKGESLLPPNTIFDLTAPLPVPKKKEHLSLGSSKTLDWELVKRRNNLEELLPIWFRLGQMVESSPALLMSPSLLNTLVSSNDLDYFQYLSPELLYPQNTNLSNLGFDIPLIGRGEDPLTLLTEGYRKIRSTLLKEEEDKCYILPEVLRFFPHGRAANIQASFGSLDIEWTKGFLRRMTIDATISSRISLLFPKTHKKCLLTSSSGLKLPTNLDCTLDLRASTQYFLEYFQE